MFSSGEALKPFDAGMTSDITQAMVITGILGIYSDLIESDSADFPGVDARVLKKMVGCFSSSFDYPSVLALVLTSADTARTDFDEDLYSGILRSGLHLLTD